METVQIECGSCNRVMAISIEHLGSQVHCPHCQAIVQAPPRPAGKAVEIRGDSGETESIFAGPEVTDDIFNSGPSGPLVEMPLEKFTQKKEDASSGESLGTMPYMPPEGPKISTFNLAKANEETREAPSAPSWTDASTIAQESMADNANLAALQPRRVDKQSAVAPILLIFLVPYAILATVVIAYLLINQSRAFDPLERLPDPKPKDGGPRVQERVVHDWPLPNKLKTRLNEALRIGALQVTPVKVLLTRDDHLVLHLKMKNVSKDLVFNPVSEEFMKFTPGMVTTRPYTFLDWSQKKLYGGFPLRGPDGKEEHFFDGDIGPGQEELVRIFTGPNYKDDVKRLANSQETVVWRVQVRRGFVDVRGSQVSATAVVGVEFNAKAIQKES